MFGSVDAAENEFRNGLAVSGVIDLSDAAADDSEEVEVVDGVAEEDRKTDPNTRFAFSRDASFLSSMRNLEGFLGSLGGGAGRRSNGTKPAGSRVMCIE